MEFSPQFQTYFTTTLRSRLQLGLSSGYFSSDFPTKILYALKWNVPVFWSIFMLRE